MAAAPAAMEDLPLTTPWHAERIVVPWGAAHMPGIAREIERSGFRLGETRDYLAIRFGS